MAEVGRVGDKAQFDLLSSHMQTTKSALSTAVLQQTTGKDSHLYSEMAPRASEYLNLEDALSKTGQYLNNIQLADTRLETQRGKITLLLDNLTELRVRTTGALDPTVTDFGYQRVAKDMLDTIRNALNATDAEGRSLFGGHKTDGAVVDFTNLGVLDPDNKATYLYALGNESAPTVDIADNKNVAYGITAFEKGIARTLYAFNRAATAATPDDMRAVLDAAGTAIGEVSGILSDILSTQSTFKKEKELLENDKLFIQENLSDINDVDTATATMNARILEAQLLISAYALQSAFDKDLLSIYMK